MIDTRTYPMLNDPDHPPRCVDCEGLLVRSEGFGIWHCPNDGCGADPESDAELDGRLQSEAEAAEERRLARGA